MKKRRHIHRVVQQMVSVLKERYQPEQIILFGSYASGTPHRDSDIDLLIVKSTRKPFFQRLAEVRHLVSDVRQGRPFDPVVLTPMELERRLKKGDQFFQEILHRGKILYAAA